MNYYCLDLKINNFLCKIRPKFQKSLKNTTKSDMYFDLSRICASQI